MIYEFIKDKTILITGGTGSIGSEILKYLIPLKPKKIKIFSRDEYKQYQLKFMYPANEFTQFDYILGDVRDKEALISASRNTDIIFHCSAYKHVPQSEELPEEFIKTNILGSLNVKKAALENNIPVVISISSDKAVYPSNVMGLTKAIQEKIFSSHSLQKENSKVRLVNIRFGNVIGTKGSLFPIFYHQIMNKIPLTVTHPDMTRFFMSKREAIELIFWATMYGQDGQIVVKKMKSLKVGTLIKVLLKVAKQNDDYPVRILGIRVGEKMHESLLTEDELFKVKEKGKYYVIAPYSDQEIQKNIITNSKKATLMDLEQFHSDTDSNYLTEKEIEVYVKEFIEEVKNRNQIL